MRLQVACSLGFWRDARAGEALASIALRDPGDEFVRAAV
ncbi:MAG: hypothetical protein AVDCRST_MAG64-84, partial [uncultured Phycisphaerae bacterium]